MNIKHHTSRTMAGFEVYSRPWVTPPALTSDTKDVTGSFLVSRKVNGIRVVFREGKLYTKNGTVIDAPGALIAGIPKGYKLDGELHRKDLAGGGETFGLPNVVFRKHARDEEWDKVAISWFDIDDGGTMPFLQRYAELVRLSAVHGLPIVKHKPLSAFFSTTHSPAKERGPQDVKTVLRKVHALGWEGLVLRDPDGLYRTGEQRTIVKAKYVISFAATFVESPNVFELPRKWDGARFKISRAAVDSRGLQVGDKVVCLGFQQGPGARPTDIRFGTPASSMPQ